MAVTAPKLRSDLIISRQQTASETVFIVKDPITGGFFRLQEVEGFVAQQLDGETSLDVVRRRAEEKFGGLLATETLHAFVKHLEKTGLLETEHRTAKRGTGHRSRMRGSLLYLRFPLFDPDRLLTRLVHRLRFFLTRRFVVLAGALILLAVGITMAHAGDIARDASRLYQLATIPLFVALILLVFSAHEFAHGLTCKHFGGEVHEMGFMLIYFQPAFYCNVSDAWLFPEKAKRLWVSFAGAYFELFLWALATLTWWATDVDTWINYVALTVMAISGIKSLLNFNPFIKLDGYYLLSDSLDIPNLRKRSFLYLGGLIKRLVGLEPGMAPEISQRERRIFLSYGLVATALSTVLLLYVFVKAGGFLMEIRQPAALALLTGFVGVRFRRRFRKLFGTTSASGDWEDDDNHVATPRPGDPVVMTGLPRTRHRSRHRSRKRLRRKRIVWTALAAGALGLLFFGRLELRIAAPFRVLPDENADVRPAVEGIVEEVYVDEGREVQAGDVVVRLSNQTLLADSRKTEAEMRETQAILRRLEVGPTAEEIAVARAAFSRAQDRLSYAQTGLTRLRSLFEANVVTRQELEAAQNLATTAESDLAEARGRLNVLLRGTRSEEVDAARARLDRLTTQQRYLEEQLRLLNVVSPVAGVVATPSRQLKELQRQLVGKGDLIAKVYDFRTVTAHIPVSEKEIADVRVGQRVVLRARAHPNAAFHGHVAAIATAAEGSSIPGAGGETSSSGGGAFPGQAFIVTAQIDNRSLLLKPGMTGHAKVMAGPRRIVGLITRRLARTFKVEFWSWL